MKTINIKGKEYVPVNERIKEFLQRYPNHRIITEIVSMDENSVVMVAKAYNEEGTLIGTGHAQEERNYSTINKVSFVEVCETSAIGRLIGLTYGIGISDSVASADEVANAIDRQEALKQKVTKTNISALKMLAEQKGSDFDSILTYYDLAKVEDMTLEQFQSAMTLLNRKK